MVRYCNVVLFYRDVIKIPFGSIRFLPLQVFAGQSKGAGRGKQRLPLAVPAARVLQQIGGAGKIQILDTQRKARGDQGHGITKVRLHGRDDIYIYSCKA